MKADHRPCRSTVSKADHGWRGRTRPAAECGEISFGSSFGNEFISCSAEFGEPIGWQASDVHLLKSRPGGGVETCKATNAVYRHGQSFWQSTPPAKETCSVCERESHRVCVGVIPTGPNPL